MREADLSCGEVEPHLLGEGVGVDGADANWSAKPKDSLVSLAAAKDKFTQIDNAIQQRNATIQLGMPSFPQIAGRTATTSATLPTGCKMP